MLTFYREVRAAAPAAAVYDYLADFTTTNEWDPRAFDTVLVDGAGGSGSRYDCNVRFLGRTTQMTYEITELSPHQHIEWVGTNGVVRARDVISLHSPTPEQTAIHYTSIYDYAGRYRAVQPLLQVALNRLCDEAQDGLSRTLTARFAA